MPDIDCILYRAEKSFSNMLLYSTFAVLFPCGPFILLHHNMSATRTLMSFHRFKKNGGNYTGETD